MRQDIDYTHLRDRLQLPSELAKRWSTARTHPYECTSRLEESTGRTVSDIVSTIMSWNNARHTRTLSQEQERHAQNVQGALFHTDYISDERIIQSLRVNPPQKIALAQTTIHEILQEGLADATTDARYWRPAVRTIHNQSQEQALLKLMINSLAGTSTLPQYPAEDMFALFHMLSIQTAHKNPESMHLARITHSQKEYCISVLSNIIAHGRSPYISYLAGTRD